MDEVTALLEVLGPDLERGAISADFLKNRRLRRLRLPREQSLSDLTSREVVRFGRNEAVALFGPHGERKQWRKGREQAISAQLIERLHRDCGIEVIDIPTADQLQRA